MMLLAINVTLKAYSNTTPDPEIYIEENDDFYIITADGEGDVILYVEGDEVNNPYVIARPEPYEVPITLYVYATAQVEGMEMGMSEMLVEIQPKEGEEPPIAPDPGEKECWLVALDKDDNEIWTKIDYIADYYSAYVSFDLCHYTNWNYYDQTGTRYVRTYFVIDGERYIADGFNPDVWDDYYSLEQSNEYMHWNTGMLYQIAIFDDDDNHVLIQGQLPSGYWEDYIVLTDKDGNEINIMFGMSSHCGVDLDKATYGSSDVYFHFKREYPFYKSFSYFGAETDGLAATSGVPFADKLYSSTNNFKVPAGFHYDIGIFGDVFGDDYLYLLQGETIPDGDSIKRGDVNGDDEVTIDDLTALIDILLTDSAESAEADCNQDGSVTIDDVTALIDYLLTGSW